MRYRRFEFEKKPPVFRPPKYTGITLSLLSIFVLVSMLAVWEKMARIPELPVLNILAWDKSKGPLDAAKSAYQKEKSCIINIHYLTQAKFLAPQLLTQEKDRRWDLFLVPQVADFKLFYPGKNYLFRSHVAYFKDQVEGRTENTTNQISVPLSGWTNQTSDNLAEALSFLRFLKAPTKGQVEFAMDGWTGVNEDHWDISPEFKIYAVEEAKDIFSKKVQEFAKEEGINPKVSLLQRDNLFASLELLTKANNKNYLPDLVCLPAAPKPPAWLFPYYVDYSDTAEILDGEFVLFIRKKSPLLKTVQKFSRTLSEN